MRAGVQRARDVCFLTRASQDVQMAHGCPQGYGHVNVRAHWMTWTHTYVHPGTWQCLRVPRHAGTM